MHRFRLILTLAVVALAGLMVSAFLLVNHSSAANLETSPAGSATQYRDALRSYLPLDPLAEWLPADTHATQTQAIDTITGYIYEPDGFTPVPSSTVYIFDSNGNPFGSTTTTPSGTYTLTSLLPGTYLLYAYPPAGLLYGFSEVSYVEVFNGQTSNLDLYLRPVLVSGWVQDGLYPPQRFPFSYIVAHNADWSTELWATTNLLGDFLFSEGLTVGVSYTLEVIPPSDSSYIPGPPLQVTPVITAAALDVFMPPLNIVGIIQDPAGNAVPNASVYLTDDNSYRAETQTEVDGSFALRGIPLGGYWLQASPPWGAQNLLSSSPISITITDTKNVIDVGLQALPYALKIVTGRVVNSVSGEGVTDVVAWANRLDNNGFNATPTDLNGSFSLSLAGGEWLVGVQPNTWPASWFFVGPPAWVNFNLDNTLPETTTLTLEVLPANAFISGRIVCPGGNPCQVESPPDTFQIVASNDLIYNRTELDPSYSFILPVVEGWYEVSLTTEDPRLIAPHLPPIYVSPGEVVDLGDIEFLPRNAAISGSLQNEFGDPVPDVPLHFWSADGSFADWTRTNAAGVYTMPVSAGEWFITAEPEPAQPFVHLDPPRQVIVNPGQNLGGVNFVLYHTDAVIHGYAVDAGNSQMLYDLDGWAYSELVPPGNDPYAFSDTPAWGGQFNLKAIGGQAYNVGLALPPQSEYMSSQIGPVLVDPNQVVTVALPVEAKDAWVVGSLVDARSGQTLIGPYGVYGIDDQGRWSAAGVDPINGQFSLGLKAGDWAIGVEVDPRSGYAASTPAAAVTIETGEVITQVIPLWPVDAFIRGRVFSPQGAAVPGVYVYARGESSGLGYFEAYAQSDASGFYELKVPQGLYAVGVSAPAEELSFRGWINPPLFTNYPATRFPAGSLDFHFRQLDGQIQGTLSFPVGTVLSATQSAYVWGWTETGEWAEATVSFTNNVALYTLNVISGTDWHIGAVYEDWSNNVYYESSEAIIFVPSGSGMAFQDLVLDGPNSFFKPVILSFDATQMQTIVLPDGARLDIPAGALSDSGHVTLFIFPTRELGRRTGLHLVGLGYDMWAVNGAGRKITHFNQNIRITIPYPSDDTLAALGINEVHLAPAYYSTLLEHWVVVKDFLRDPLNNQLAFQSDHFTRFIDLSLDNPGTKLIFLPILAR